jgi:hypothetical protein
MRLVGYDIRNIRHARDKVHAAQGFVHVGFLHRYYIHTTA